MGNKKEIEMVKDKLLALKDAELAFRSIETLPEEFDTEVAEREVAAYEKGVADGKASVTNPEDKVYSQEEMDAALLPLKQEIEAVKAESDKKVLDAVEAKRAEIEALYLAEQEVESGAESALKAALAKPVESTTDTDSGV
jgi:vacuolar-type H+-ATPase subunit C/Vma6